MSTVINHLKHFHSDSISELKPGPHVTPSWPTTVPGPGCPVAASAATVGDPGQAGLLQHRRLPLDRSPVHAQLGGFRLVPVQQRLTRARAKQDGCGSRHGPFGMRISAFGLWWPGTGAKCASFFLLSHRDISPCYWLSIRLHYWEVSYLPGRRMDYEGARGRLSPSASGLREVT